MQTILEHAVLKPNWYAECKQTADRIISMRTSLKNSLKTAGSTRNWDHIVNQIRMFAFTGLNTEQVGKMRTDHHVYTTKDGRISTAGVTSKNVEYVAKAMHAVSK